MNIPPEVARAQAHHGIKGAAHGSKGGRPKLDLTDDERKERRRQQHEDYRRRKGIMRKKRRKSWTQDYLEIWGKPPGVPLTPEEFAQREPLWNARVLEQQEAGRPKRPRVEDRLEARLEHIEQYDRTHQPRKPYRAHATVGRNEPCPCGSGRKFKKCCGR